MPDEKSHHVAWADRIGLNKQWARDIQACSEAYGTAYFPIMVKRFRMNMVDIKNGPSLKDEIDEYVNRSLLDWKGKQLQFWMDRNPQKINHQPSIRTKKEDIEYAAHEELYKYMIQLLNDNGFGFYESDIETDEML